MYLHYQRRESIRFSIIVTATLGLLLSVHINSAQAQNNFWYGSGQLPYDPVSQMNPMNVAVSQLFPGGGSPPPEDPIAKQYQGNPSFINEGHRLFLWYNCVGCHSNGAGGMGPGFLDNDWRYGGRLDQIFASIYQGRPNGMPSWGRKIPNGQIWELAAFVKSLSAPAAANGPGETVPGPPQPEAGQPPKPQTSSAASVQMPH
jgi:cytochrome c oxidase cbb3-type subunit 3